MYIGELGPNDFAFISTPHWWSMLHPRGKERYAVFLWLKYIQRHNPEQLRSGAWFRLNYYPLWWMFQIVGRKILAVLLIAALLGIPSLAGLLIGLGIHMTITFR